MTEARLPAATRPGRVALDVPDLAPAVAFYRDVVGLAVRDRAEDRVTLGAPDGALLVLRSTATAGDRPPAAAGLFHTAIRVPTRAALADTLERIESRDGLEGASDHGVSEALYLRDPAGNGVEVYRDRPRAAWATSDGRVQLPTRPLDLADLRADAGDGDRAPAGTRVGHVHLEVTDLDAAREFYVDTLGLTVRAAVDGGLFVAAGDYHHHVGLNVWRGRSAPTSGRGLEWFEMLLPEERALERARERIVAAGYDREGVGDGVLVRDPDAIGLYLRSE